MSGNKLTEAPKAVQLLRKNFRNGEVSFSDNAKTVWESEPIFMKHKLDDFRTKFTRLKTEHEEYEINYIYFNFF